MGKPHKTVGLGVSAGMETSSAWRADCGGGIEVLETHTPGCQLIEVSGLNGLYTIASQMLADVMTGYHQYIWFLHS
jgi:CO/xanthine dehydrogenase Mo-binding subunit